MLKKWKILIFVLLLAVVYCWMPTKPEKDLRGKINTELKKYKNEFPNAKFAVLIDYNKPIFIKRLWVIDLKTGVTIINSHVGHALKSGVIWAKKIKRISKLKVFNIFISPILI